MPFYSELKPELKLAKSYVATCARCGAWHERWPQFIGDGSDGKGGITCPKCGCTSERLREGRPFGPKSRHWANVLRWFDEHWGFIHELEWHTVITEPPLERIPRQANGMPVDMVWKPE